MTDELKPCPFCGEQPRVSVAMDESIWNHSAVPWTTIRCDSCDANSGAVCEGDEPSAHERWNRRAPEAEPEEAMNLARRLVAVAMQEFVAHHASTIQAAQKMLNDWNHWYGEHGATMPLPPAGIVHTQEALADTQDALVTDEMVNRFLAWRLPNDFSPDCFVHFDIDQAGRAGSWPMGTNLLTAEQAKAMLRHVLGA
jgi:Lar family restriction alleviation protein